MIYAWWVARGQPDLKISQFFSSTTPRPTPTRTPPTPAQSVLLSPGASQATTPNPWMHLIANAVVHPDDHFPKLQRALVHYATMYGKSEAGREDFGSTELEGADKRCEWVGSYRAQGGGVSWILSF